METAELHLRDPKHQVELLRNIPGQLRRSEGSNYVDVA